MSNTKHPSNLDRLADSPGGRERLADIDPRPNAVTLTWTRKTWERRRLHTGEHAAAHPVAPRKLRAYVDGNVHAASWDVAIVADHDGDEGRYVLRGFASGWGKTREERLAFRARCELGTWDLGEAEQLAELRAEELAREAAAYYAERAVVDAQLQQAQEATRPGTPRHDLVAQLEAAQQALEAFDAALREQLQARLRDETGVGTAGAR